MNKDANRYGGPGAGVLATIRARALNTLGLYGHRSISAELAAVALDIPVFLAKSGDQPKEAT